MSSGTVRTRSGVGTKRGSRTDFSNPTGQSDSLPSQRRRGSLPPAASELGSSVHTSRYRFAKLAIWLPGSSTT